MAVVIRANQNQFQTNFGVTGKKTQEQQKQGNLTSVNMSLSAGQSLEEQISVKRNYAQKQAFKLIGDAWKKDQSASNHIDSMSELKTKKLGEIHDFKARIKEIGEMKQALQEEYGIESGSTEQKDLELLEKYQDNINGISCDEFSEEEIERLKELQNAPLTDYQKQSLQLNAAKNANYQNADRLQQQVRALTSSISQAMIDKLKSQDMLDAQTASEDILNATEKEIFSMLMQDGKDKIDKDLEEEQEKAEETAEKREEQTRQLEEAKEERKETQEIVEGEADLQKLDADISMQKQTYTNVDEAQKTIQTILKKNQLINEDLKGIEIDLNF